MQIALTKDGTNYTMYSNGSSIGSTTSAKVPTGASGVLKIGRWANSNAYDWNGQMDEIQMYNRSLSSEEISNLYNTQLNRFYPTGTQLFNNTNVSDGSGTENRLNISLAGYQNLLDTNISVSVNGTFVNLNSSGAVDNLQFTDDPETLNITFKFTSNTSTYYTPLMIGNITLDAFTSGVVPPVAGKSSKLIIQNLSGSDLFTFDLDGIMAFILGETIDNLIDGWLRITGGLNITDNLIVGGNVTARWFNGKFNWTTIDGWNSFDGSILTFNETKLDNKLATIEYNASTITTLVGNLDSGVLSDVLVRDDIFYNVSEVTGSPGFNIQLNYTGVANFNDIVTRLNYDGSAAHDVVIEILDCVAGVYDTKIEFMDTDGVVDIIEEILDPIDYICGIDQNVSLQIRHASSGNPAHNIFIDGVHLVKGVTTASPNEIDPLSLHRSGDVINEGNQNWGGFNLTDVDSGFFTELNVTGNLTADFHFLGNGAYIGYNATCQMVFYNSTGGVMSTQGCI